MPRILISKWIPWRLIEPYSVRSANDENLSDIDHTLAALKTPNLEEEQITCPSVQ